MVITAADGDLGLEEGGHWASGPPAHQLNAARLYFTLIFSTFPVKPVHLRTIGLAELNVEQ